MEYEFKEYRGLPNFILKPYHITNDICYQHNESDHQPFYQLIGRVYFYKGSGCGEKNKMQINMFGAAGQNDTTANTTTSHYPYNNMRFNFFGDPEYEEHISLDAMCTSFKWVNDNGNNGGEHQHHHHQHHNHHNGHHGYLDIFSQELLNMGMDRAKSLKNSEADDLYVCFDILFFTKKISPSFFVSELRRDRLNSTVYCTPSEYKSMFFKKYTLWYKLRTRRKLSDMKLLTTTQDLWYFDNGPVTMVSNSDYGTYNAWNFFDGSINVFNRLYTRLKLETMLLVDTPPVYFEVYFLLLL